MPEYDTEEFIDTGGDSVAIRAAIDAGELIRKPASGAAPAEPLTDA